MQGQLYTGVDFELYIQSLFLNCGCKVFTTPASNDYGADLIVQYRNEVIAIQCKFYNRLVGVKAVQEICGARNYYKATILAVITNSGFTQQAQTLAEVNHVLLIDGAHIAEISPDRQGSIPLFNKWMEYSCIDYAPENVDLVLTDLVVRYGLNQQQIMQYFVSAGMPYYKVGREYHFNLQELEEWEIDTRKVFYGHNQVYYLPGWYNRINYLKREMDLAKKNNDMARFRILKEEWWAIKEPHSGLYRKIIKFCLIAAAIFLLYAAVVMNKSIAYLALLLLMAGFPRKIGSFLKRK